MILRRCSQGHRVRIYRNTTPGISRTKKYKDGSTEVLTYPSSYSYFVEVDGNVEKKTNSFNRAIIVEKATMIDEKIIPLKNYKEKKAPYFSIILVPYEVQR